MMNYRELGRTGWKVSEVSFGAWAIGGAWGEVDDRESLAALHRAIDLGVNFIDTADVYGDGRSERLIAQVRKERSEQIYVATKAGRRLDPHVAEGYNSRETLTSFIERSLSAIYPHIGGATIPARKFIAIKNPTWLLSNPLLFNSCALNASVPSAAQ